MFYTTLNDVNTKGSTMNIAKKIAKTALWLIPATAALMCSSWASDRILEVWTK